MFRGKHKKRNLCSVMMALLMVLSVFPAIPMTTSAAAKTIWVEVKSKTSKTPTQAESAILRKKNCGTGYHLEYVGGNKKCKHTSTDGSSGKMYFNLSNAEKGAVTKNPGSYFPINATSFSKATVTKKFLTDRLTFTGSLKKHDANVTLDFSNFIMGPDGTDVYGTSKKKGKGSEYVSTICAVFTGNEDKGIKPLRGAYQYTDVDKPNGGAAYAYFSQTYSYCAATDYFYHVSESVTHMHCCMNPDRTVGVSYKQPDGTITYGHANNEDSFDEPYEHYIAKFNIVPNSYTLTVKPNGGTWNGKTTDQAFTLAYKGTKSIANPTRTGYTFAGWTLSGAGSSLSGTTFTMGSANATLTAKWTKNSYTLTVKPNGGTWGGKTTDQAFTIAYKGTKTIANPTRAGYTFAGWTLSGAGSSLSGTTFTMGSANATLTAKWTINSYTLTVKPNGGTWNGSTADQAFTIAYKGTKTIANPTRAGYTFAGWTLSGAGSSLSGTTFTMGSANATLTAKWTINSYTLTVKPNGGTWNGSTADQAFTLAYKGIKSIANPTRAGYTFAGWTLSGAGSSLSGTTFTMGSANATLTAKWTINSYTLTVKPNGGTWNGSTTDQAFTLAYKGTKSIANPTRAGYTFAGWTLSGAGSSLSGTTFTMGSANATLTAGWRQNTYIIRFDGNGATEGSMDNVTAAIDTPFTLPANNYKRTTESGDSCFLGWALAPDTQAADFADQAAVNQNLATEPDAVVTLYAVWDDCPWLEVTDRYFNLWWAQNGRITEQELLRTVSATDREDVTLECRTSEELAALGTEKSISLYDYDAGSFTSMTGSGEVTVTYRAIDSVGNTVYKEAVIHVYDTSPLSSKEAGYTRYINKKYYEKSYEEGGLHPNSIWRKDPEYRRTLENALNNLENDNPKDVYYFSPEDVKEAKSYMEEHGFSDTKEPGALQGFYDRFMR